MHSLGDTLGVGKEDGFYRYVSAEANSLTNLYPEGGVTSDPENFSRGTMYNGMFYTATGETWFQRWNGAGWESLDHVIQSPAFSQIGNRVRALGTNGQWLFVLVEEPVANSISKTCWLLALREFSSGWVAHPL